MVVGSPGAVASVPAPEGHAVGETDGKDEKRRDQVDDCVTNVRSVFEPGRYSADIVEVICQHHEQDGESAELIDGRNSRDGGRLARVGFGGGFHWNGYLRLNTRYVILDI